MKRPAVAWVLARAALVVSGGVVAQNPAPPPAGARIISYKEAIRIALEQNVSVRAAQNSAALGEVGVSEARGQFLPNLTLSSAGARNFGRSFDQQAGEVVSQTTKSLSLGVNSGVVLFDGFGNIAQYKSAKLNSQASAEDLHRARETVAFSVASQFLALISRQAQIREQRQNLQA